MEVWGRDPGTGLATRIGNCIVSQYWCGLCSMLTSILQDLHTPANPPELEFWLSDFLDVTPEDDRRITFNWWKCMEAMKTEIISQAIWRYEGMLLYEQKRNRGGIVMGLRGRRTGSRGRGTGSRGRVTGSKGRGTRSRGGNGVGEQEERRPSEASGGRGSDGRSKHRVVVGV